MFQSTVEKAEIIEEIFKSLFSKKSDVNEFKEIIELY